MAAKNNHTAPSFINIKKGRNSEITHTAVIAT